MSDDERTEVPPAMFRDGQGRGDGEIEDDGRVLGTLLCWAFFLVVGIFIGLAI